MNRSDVNKSVVNASIVNSGPVNSVMRCRQEDEGGGEIEVISNCWLLEDSVGAWLWEDGTPMLLESNPVRLMRVFKK